MDCQCECSTCFEAIRRLARTLACRLRRRRGRWNALVLHGSRTVALQGRARSSGVLEAASHSGGAKHHVRTGNIVCCMLLIQLVTKPLRSATWRGTPFVQVERLRREEAIAVAQGQCRCRLLFAAKLLPGRARSGKDSCREGRRRGP